MIEINRWGTIHVDVTITFFERMLNRIKRLWTKVNFVGRIKRKRKARKRYEAQKAGFEEMVKVLNAKMNKES